MNCKVKIEVEREGKEFECYGDCIYHDSESGKFFICCNLIIEQKEISEMKIIRVLSLEPLRYKELKEKTGLTDPTLSKHLKEMEEKNEIVRTTIKGKRGVYYKLTGRKYDNLKSD